MNQQKEKTSYIYYYLLINFAANSKKSATFLKLSNCWQYILAQGSGNLMRISTFIMKVEKQAFFTIRLLLSDI